MTRIEEFNSFYAGTSRQTLELAYALCGDRQVAFESTVTAYRHAWRDWLKIRDREALSYVRTEAWRQTGLSKGTHPLRRKHEEDSDTELLDALSKLSSDDRRLLALMTLGDIDLEQASYEVGVPAEEGIEHVTHALTELETSLGQSIGEIERRLHALATITTKIVLPRGSTVRKAAKRGRQLNTVGLVAAALIAIVGSGFVVSDGDAMQSSADLPQRQKLGAEEPDVQLSPKAVDADQLLTVEQVQRLDPEQDWEVVSTDDNPANTEPYATCPTERFANENPARVFVRTYKTGSETKERVAQSVEVARESDTALAAYDRLLSWYADCAHPRTRLIGAWTVKRPIGDFEILRLRSDRSPERTFTVGFSHSGTVTSTLVHEIEAGSGPDIDLFADALNDSVSRVCVASGGDCTSDIEVERTDPPPTSADPGFLGIVDLPPVASIDNVWAGTETSGFEENPARTQCDQASFEGDGIREATTKTFVIPEADDLPAEFGLVETVGRFEDEEAAEDFIDDTEKTVEDCPDSNLSASLDQRADISADGGVVGKSWRIGFEVDGEDTVYYRMALVRRGADVAQVTFTGADDFAIGEDAFGKVAERAGQRMQYLN